MGTSIEDAKRPLWQEPAFRTTLGLAGLAGGVAALGGTEPASVPWSGWVLTALFGAAYVGAVGAGAAPRLLSALRFGALAVLLPWVLGGALATAGLVPGSAWLGALAALGALFSMPAVASLEEAPPPDVAPRGAATGRAPLVSAALFTLAVAAAHEPGRPAGTAQLALGAGLFVAAAAWLGGGVLGQLRYRSFQAPRAAAAALLLCGGGGMAAAGFAWF